MLFTMIIRRTVFAPSAPFAQRIGFKTISAIYAYMLFIIKTVGTDVMLTMIVLCAFFTQSAVLTFRILRAESAFGTKVFLVIA